MFEKIFSLLITILLEAAPWTTTMPVMPRASNLSQQPYLFLITFFFFWLLGEKAKSDDRIPAATVPLAITVSGGVSLGAYQAGFLYYFTETMRINPKLASLHLVTGASAGGVNSLLTAMASCSDKPLRANDSMFWKVWTGVGINELFRPEEVTATSIFSRRSLMGQINQIQTQWAQGLREGCDVVIGITATRLTAEEMPLGDSLATLPRIEEKFLLRIRGRGPKKEPLLTNYTADENVIGYARLPEESKEGAITFERFVDILLASAAFPVAFAPQPVTFCAADLTLDHPRSTKCALKNAKTSLFIDGGVFDTRPVGLAARAAATGLVKNAMGNLVWQDTPDFTKTVQPDSLRFSVVDVSSYAYPSPETEQTTPDAFIPLLGHLASNFVATARAKELVSLFEVQPELRTRVAVNQTFLPRASELLEAFFGFFERSFREYDFTIGMLDAEQYIRQFSPTHATVALPDERSKDWSWEGLRCIRGMVDGNATLKKQCHGEHLRDFRILLQTSLDRLYDQCERLSKSDPIPTTRHPLCRAAMRSEQAPRVPGVEQPKNHHAKRKDSENETQYMLRLLAAYGFEFRDLGLSRKRADQAPLYVSAKLSEMGNAFGDAQGVSGQIVRLGTRLAAGAIAYAPPKNSFYALFGSRVALGWTHTDPLSRYNWLRFTTALTLDGIATIFSSNPTRFAFTPMVGVEFEPVPLNTLAVQWRFGLGAGYRFSSVDEWTGAGTCPTGDNLFCSGLELETHVAVTFFTFVRFQLGAAYWPAFDNNNGSRWELIPLLGLQLDDPF